MAEAKGQTVIIGAGLGGLTLALSLHRHSIPCEIYELRAPSYTHGGAIMLSPNALRILDSLDIWKPAKPHGFQFETLTFLTDSHDTTGHYYFGSESKYGYPGFRIYRNELVRILSEAVKDRGIPIHYNRKFTHIVSETDSDVTFAFEDGETKKAARLIGTDGTHSKVRNYLTPDLSPVFSGSLGITSPIPFSKLRVPHSTYSFPASISSKNGAFVMAPQDPKGAELFSGRQLFVEGRDRKGWDDLANDQDKLFEMLSAQKSEWSDLVQSALEATEKGQISIWAFHTLPKLDTWFSDKGRVVIMGDAAHAIPPTAGQGANQAFEDGFTLAWLINKCNTTEGLTATALRTWFIYRQQRIAKVMELNRKMMNMRLPLAEQAQLQDFDAKFGNLENLQWLFEPDLETEMAKLF